MGIVHLDFHRCHQNCLRRARRRIDIPYHQFFDRNNTQTHTRTHGYVGGGGEEGRLLFSSLTATLALTLTCGKTFVQLESIVSFIFFSFHFVSYWLRFILFGLVFDFILSVEIVDITLFNFFFLLLLLRYIFAPFFSFAFFFFLSNKFFILPSLRFLFFENFDLFYSCNIDY